MERVDSPPQDPAVPDWASVKLPDLQPGGLLAICEPSAQQWRLSLRNLGPATVYFHLLARKRRVA